MIVLYSAFLVFPGGTPASDYPVTVRPVGSNQSARMFSDATASTPLANPLTTDANGFVQFYAAPGRYTALVGTEAQPVPLDESVTDPVHPGLWVHEQSSAASVWTVHHHFGVVPTVDVVVGDDVVDAAVSHPSDETTLITLAAPASGTAYLRR